MSQFYPETYIPTKPYIPNYIKPSIQEINGDKLELEIGSNNVKSVINLKESKIEPFIDMNKYDIVTKQWFWYDSINNLPFRIITTNDDFNYCFESIYYSLTDGPFGIDSFQDQKYNRDNNKNRIEITANNADKSESYTFYVFSPIILTIDDIVINDITDYNNKTINPFSLNTNIKREFYYDFNGHIYTNQNFDAIKSKDIKLYVYTLPNTINVKARFKSNCGSQSYYTPYIDYYIVKLNGQSL